MALKKKCKINAEFNMSSMTDLIFLLLIFFVITSSVVKESVLKVVLPKGVRSESVVDKITHVYISENLQYAVENKVVEFSNIENEIARALQGSTKPTVSVGADKNIK